MAKHSKEEPLALLDMDGTVADFDGQLQKDLAKMRGPGEPDSYEGFHRDPPHIEARKDAIKRVPGWWRNLPPLNDGFHIYNTLIAEGYRIMVATKGPATTTGAWTEKLDWCRAHLPEALVTICEDKSLVYGRILVDDWPSYAQDWLEHRPRGLVIMPDRAWNQQFSHPNCFRYVQGVNDDELLQRIRAAKDR